MSEEKSHVGMEARVCAICGKQYDTGNILLDKRLKKTLTRHTVTGWGICPEDEAQLEGGARIALVECVVGEGPKHIKPEDANRTGRVGFMRREAFCRVFGVPDTQDGKPLSMVFVEEGVLHQIEAMQDNGEGDE